MKQLYIFIVCICSLYFTFAQEQKKVILSKYPHLGGVLQTDTYTFCFRITSNGYILNYRRIWLENMFRSQRVEIELAIVQHEKEVKQKIKRYNQKKNYTKDIIIGGAFFTEDLDDIRLSTSIYARIGLNFEFGINPQTIMSMEAIPLCDYYLEKYL